MALQRLKEAAEKAKHELSSSLETEINLPFIGHEPEGGEPLHVVATLTRSDLELLDRRSGRADARAPREALDDAKLTPNDIQNVVLVGGMTRMPAVSGR